MLITFIIALVIMNILALAFIHSLVYDRLNELEKRLDSVQDTSSIAFDLIRQHRHDASCHTKNPAAIKIMPNPLPRFYDPKASLDDAESTEDLNE